jgi:hypothetical protein
MWKSYDISFHGVAVPNGDLVPQDCREVLPEKLADELAERRKVEREHHHTTIRAQPVNGG